MGPNISVCPFTIECTGVIEPHTFVGVDGAVAAAGEPAIGVGSHYANAEPLTVDHLGLVRVKTAGAIAAGAEVQVGTLGRALTKGAGVTVGRCHPNDAATAADQYIRVMLIPSIDLVA